MAAPRSSVFTFESTAHSVHVLQCLDEQRRRDMLCDVTVLVEGQRFRAHRSVLASCSDYFTQRMSNLTQHEAVITLPKQVTVQGFELLLNFAYTSKLLCANDNIQEIQNAASILGFRDLDNACFDFLLPKFASKSEDFVQKRKHCKNKCNKRQLERHCSTDAGDVILDEEVKPVSDSTFQPDVNWDCQKKKMNKTRGSQSNANSLSPLLETTHATFMQCPKYRKFQLACGKERDPCLLSCSSFTKNKPSVDTTDNDSSWMSHGSKENNDRPDKSEIDIKTENIITEGYPKITDGDNKDTEVNWIKMKNHMDKCNATVKLIMDQRPLLASKESPPVPRSLGLIQDFEEDKNSHDHAEPASVLFHPKTEELAERLTKTCPTGKIETTATSENNGNDRNIMKKEEPDAESSQQNCQGPQVETSGAEGISLECLKLHTSLSKSKTNCSLLQELERQESSRKAAGLSECDGASHSGVSSLNSGEDEDLETEAEGDSESCTRERALQMQLPVPVDWVVHLSRNDFQLLLKQQDFTQEQLEFINDMRRRSKNRLAARRCRKRKLDSISNLQCEIHKLKTEREGLMMERSQLNKLKMESCQNVSALCQQVCTEANLKPGQVPVLLKLTSADSSLSSFCSYIDTLLSQHGLAPQHTSSPSCGERETL